MNFVAKLSICHTKKIKNLKVIFYFYEEKDIIMAVRPVYIPKKDVPFYETVNIEFIWNSGFAVSQKQKNITAIHDGFRAIYSHANPLEISSKSMQELGKQLSAFSLKKYVPKLGKSISVENVYQAGKVFESDGPFLDLMLVSPKESKRDERLKKSGKLIRFEFDGQVFPLVPQSLFYDYIYINAILENKELAKEIMNFNGFTDIEFNPQKSISTQAKSAAVFVALSEMGLLDKVTDCRQFQILFKTAGKLQR